MKIAQVDSESQIIKEYETHTNCKNQPIDKRCLPENQKPKSWLTESILLTLASFILSTIWCLPFAVVALVYASKVDSLWTKGDFDGARDAALKARRNYKIGLWLGVGLWLLWAGVSF